MTRLPRSELESRLCETLTRLASEIPRLELYARYWDDDAHLLRQEDKAAAEVLLLAFLATRVPRDVSDRSSALSTAIDDVLDAVSPLIATPRAEALLRRFPQTVVTVGLAQVLLMALGRSDARIEALIRRAIHRGFATLNERSVFRMMDARWAFGLLDRSLLPAPDELFALSTLGAAPHPIHTTTDDEYAVTHAAFYLTDFGARPPADAVKAVLAADLLDPFVMWAAVTDDLDLLGEHLIAATAMGAPLSASLRFGWHLFFRAWHRPEGLSGPTYSTEHHARLGGEEADAYRFGENYHTECVGAMLCAVALATANQPADHVDTRHDLAPLATRCQEAARRMPRRRPLPTTDPGGSPSLDDLPEELVARLLDVLGQSLEPSPLWLQIGFPNPLSRAESSAVLLEALIVASGRRYHLVQLAEALRVAAVTGLVHTRTFAIGLEFLLDQQLHDGFVGVQGLLGDAGTGDAGVAEAQERIAASLECIAAMLPGVSRAPSPRSSRSA